VSPVEAALGVLVGFGAGMLAGMFGVGGGILSTPAISVIYGVAPVVAVATPLPVIFPTAIVGAETYRRSGQVDLRAASWISIFGAGAAAAGAALTGIVNGHLLLIVTAVLLAWQAVEVARGASVPERAARREATVWAYAGIGVIAGLASGLLGIGGGIVIVPMLAGWFGMPLKRALGTSLAAIVAIVVPGVAVHAALGHIDWTIALVLAIGSIAGARIGAKIALGARERTLRLLVGGFLAVVAVAYGVSEAIALTSGERAAG
jgi:uncharacterized membrane protein YfcA